MRHLLARLGVILSLLAAAAALRAETNTDLAAWGLDYELRTLAAPRTNRAHILRVDFSKGLVEPVVVVAPDPDGPGPAEATLTDPLKLAADRNTLAVVNANPWDSLPDADGTKNRLWYEGQPVDINGLALTRGVERSPPGKECMPIRMTPQGKVFIGRGETNAVASEGVAGWQQIVKEGVVTMRPSDKLAPRTALGVDRESSVLWLVVVDGRQPGYSEGMSWYELAEFMAALGCWNAVNMDGGGSSVMALAGPAGRLQVKNRPSDQAMGRPGLRPVPVVLTIRKRMPPRRD